MRRCDSLTEPYCCDTSLVPLRCPRRNPAAPIELVDLQVSECAGGRPLLHKASLLNLSRSPFISACAIHFALLLHIMLWQWEEGRSQNWLSVTRKELALSYLLHPSLLVEPGRRDSKAHCSEFCRPQSLVCLPHFMLYIDSIGISRL